MDFEKMNNFKEQLSQFFNKNERQSIKFDNVYQFNEYIEKLDNDGKYQEIVEICSKEINRLAPDIDNFSDEDGEYMAALYRTLAQFVHPQEAIEYLSCALTFVDDKAPYYIQIGKIKEELSDWQGAIEDYSIVIDNAPCCEAYGYRGAIFYQFQEYELAMNDLNKSLELNPNYGGGYVNRGRVKYSIGDVEAAIKDYDKAIELYPDYPFTYGCRADAKASLKDYDGALVDFKKVMELDPNDINAKKAFLNLKINLAEEGSIKVLEVTRTDGIKVRRFFTDDGIIELPIENESYNE